jgi:mono/diheme cytochrome c family protein
MKYFLLGVVCTLAVLTLAVLGFIRFGFAEVRGDFPTTHFENPLLKAGLPASIGREAREMPNPVAATDENLIKGGKYYLEACAACHGTPSKPFGSGRRGSDSSRSAVSRGGNGIERSADFLGGEARDSAFRDVRERLVGEG